MKTQQQIDASKKISEILGKIELLYQEAAQVADESGVDFYWEGPAGTYGAGGHYSPKPAQEDWQESSSCYGNEDYGWQASSNSC